MKNPISKESYFKALDLKRDLNQQRDKAVENFNKLAFEEGIDGTLDALQKIIVSYDEGLRELELGLKHARMFIDADTLKAWGKEYRK